MTVTSTRAGPHLDDVVYEAVDAVGVEGWLANVQLIQDHTQGPQINLPMRGSGGVVKKVHVPMQ